MSSKAQPLAVGVPKEIKTGEKRVSLSPASVKKMTQESISVFVESGAGEGCGFSDRMYVNSGATILDQHKDVWQKASLIVKVKEPQPEEFSLIQKKHILFSFLHLASKNESHLIKAIMKAKATAIAFETVANEKGETPLLKPMSEIAGQLSTYLACYINKKVKVRSGAIIYPSSFDKDLAAIQKNFPKLKYPAYDGKALILGGGNVGLQIALCLAQTKAHIWITEKDAPRQREIKAYIQKHKMNMIVVDAQDRSIPSLFEKADMIFGTVYVVGRRAPILIDQETLASSSHQKKLIVDVAIDQGGNVYGSHATDCHDPVFIDPFDNLRFGVTNIPTLCPIYATKALEKVSFPYVMALAKNPKEAYSEFPELKSGVSLINGKVVNEEIAKIHKLLFETHR